MKKVLLFVLSFSILLSLFVGLDYSAYADDTVNGFCGENVNYSFDKESGTLTISGSGAMYDYSVYDEFLLNDNLSPFFDFNNLKTVVIKPGVTSIGDNAFTNCVSLNYVTIPESVTKIGRLAFFWCTSLISIDVDADNTAYSSQDGVLYNKNKTELILLPVTSSNTQLIIPNTVTKIDEYAFHENSTTKDLTIPGSVISIGDCAFEESNFSSINVDSENPVYYSQDGVLFNKDKTELLKYPRANERTSYDIPDSVERIDESAFYYCLSLTSVTIPASVISIGEKAFGDCWQLKSLTVDSDNTAFCSENDALFNKNKTELIQYLYNGNIKSYNVPDGVTRIGSYAFKSANFESVTIPDSVTDIGDNAFYMCTQLTSLTIGNGLKTIGNHSFAYCVHVTDLTLPDSLTSIGSYAFFGMQITTLRVPQNVSYIGEVPFGSKTLTYIDVDLNNDSFCSQDGVLFNKDKTKLIQCPAASEFTAYTVPDSVTYIGYFAFSYCTGLTELIIPNSVKSFGICAFIGCSGLKSVTISDGVSSISFATFLGCIGLTNVTIPVSVTRIKAAAFGNCNGIKDVYYGGTKKQWCSISINILNDELNNAVIHCTDGIIDSDHPYDPTQEEAVITEPSSDVTELISDVTEPSIEPAVTEIEDVTLITEVDYPSEEPSAEVTEGEAESAIPISELTDNTDGKKTTAKVTSSVKRTDVSVKPSPNLKKPARVRIKRVKAGKKRFKITWKRVKNADGYIIQYSLNKKFKKGKKYATKKITVKNAKTAKRIIKRLKKNKKYYVRVRAYRKAPEKKLLGKWSRTRTVKVK